MKITLDRLKNPNLGRIIINLLRISQYLITFSFVATTLYTNIIGEIKNEWVKTFSKEVRPLQILLGCLFFIWWIRSNDWKEKTLPVTPELRMIIFQYSLISIYIAFDLIIQYWGIPNIQ
tara:strand:- start:68 stop:424 length:357 start_codon:yes stop_codon:yes gene_type:complete